MAFHSSTAQKRENQIKSRYVDEKGEGDSSATLATAKASDGYLSISVLSASWWLELIQQWERSESKLTISLMESHPTVKSCFFSPLFSIYVQAASPSFPYFTPPSLTPSSLQNGGGIKLWCCLLLLPYSLSLQVVTSLLRPVLTVCISYFPVLHSSQWHYDLLNVFQINKI